jgi:arginyl-tRNA--protein-N-Asp/Glu arginylyltransferase
MKNNGSRRLRRTASQINIYHCLCIEISVNNFTLSSNETKYIQNHKTFQHAYNKSNERINFLVPNYIIHFMFAEASVSRLCSEVNSAQWL